MRKKGGGEEGGGGGWGGVKLACRYKSVHLYVLARAPVQKWPERYTIWKKGVTGRTKTTKTWTDRGRCAPLSSWGCLG